MASNTSKSSTLFHALPPVRRRRIPSKADPPESSQQSFASLHETRKFWVKWVNWPFWPCYLTKLDGRSITVVSIGDNVERNFLINSDNYNRYVCDWQEGIDRQYHANEEVKKVYSHPQ